MDFKVDKIRSTTAPCRKILLHVKELYEFERQNSATISSPSFFPASLLDGCSYLPESSGGRIRMMRNSSLTCHHFIRRYIALATEKASLN
jgi:hypothetical protein